VNTIHAREIRSTRNPSSLTFEEFSTLLARLDIVPIPDGIKRRVSSIDSPADPTPPTSA
jgi:hypothetical protein